MFNSVDYIQKNLPVDKQELFYRYVKLILEWNKRINITSRHNTRTRIYNFICEGIAMSALIDNHQAIIADIGSGAGFPGIVLVIMGFTNLHLIEVNHKKAVFLQYVLAELGLKATVHNQDVRKVSLSKVNYITSKAVTKSNEIISLSKTITGEDTKFVLCKNSDDGHIGGNLTEIILTDKLGFEKKYNFISY